MKRLLGIVAALVVLSAVAVAGAWWGGALALPIGTVHPELAAQLRDRGTVAVLGPVPLGLRGTDASLVPASRFAPLRTALEGTSLAAVAPAVRAEKLDGLMVRTDRPEGAAGTAGRALAEMRAVPGLTATYLDETAAFYESSPVVEISPAEARQLIEVVRLVLQGAVPPPERLFPASIRRAQPSEVAVIVRDGREPVLWRAVRGGSVARALLDASYAVLDRWNTRQQARFGPLREAIGRQPLTVAIFYDRGTLGDRSPAFLERAVDPRVFAIGYELLGRWEYVLPPTPWAPNPPPVQAISTLAREHDVAPPGYLRPELTLYRFRALQLIELEAQGAVQVFDPS